MPPTSVRFRHRPTAARCAVDFLIPTLLVLSGVGIGSSASAAPLKTLNTGLGSGRVTSAPSGIDCGSACERNFASGTSVTLTAVAATGSTFVGWIGDCTGTGTCTVNTSSDRSVRAEFRLNTPIPTMTSFTPEALSVYLTANPSVNTAARFIAALPAEFRQNWLMMSRSESLQTGTAELPRFMLTSGDATQVFTFGLGQHASYPASHPDAIEYMQWDPAQKNFRFHEIVLASIPAVVGANGPYPLFGARSRGVSVDDIKCSRCHSTRNVMNTSASVGTNGIPPGLVKVKSKPNWDAYDSWGGMLPFNRDRIYQGTVEAAAFRKLLNPWTWRANPSVRAFIEQLALQPPGILDKDQIERLVGGANDGHIRFAFDPPGAAVLTEPPPGQEVTETVAYDFDGGVAAASTVQRFDASVTLRHSSQPQVDDEGRGVQLFDLLGGLDGKLNQLRISDEIVSHRFATGSVPIDVRPVALAIVKNCLSIDSELERVRGTSAAPLTVDQTFFEARNGMNVNALRADTKSRTESLPRRKVDIQRFNLDRTNDIYLQGGGPGLIAQYGANTSFLTSTSLERLRQEIFRRPIDRGIADLTIMGGKFVDREEYGTNTVPVTLFRYFLEPLGVSVDKWSMGVRGRSRTYSFADVFPSYIRTFGEELTASLTSEPYPGLPASSLNDCSALIGAVNTSLGALPGKDDVPTYTDVQRVLNKGCIECHGGLKYPPIFTPPYNVGYLDLSENDGATSGDERMRRSHTAMRGITGPELENSLAYIRITQTDEKCPGGMMPCGGPALSKSDIETIRRWILGGRPYTEGDPHITTIDGVQYDFQSAGEFVLLKDEFMEIQTRQVPVETAAPLAPDAHSGLASCVSVNGAVAVRVGSQRITYQPDPWGNLINLNLLDEFGMDELGILDFGLNALAALFNLGSPQLRVDGRVISLDSPYTLSSGGRIVPTDAPGGVKIEVPGGTEVVITPGFWSYYQLWYLNLDVRRGRGTQGVMGAVAPGNWLPALPNGTLLGARPADLHQRYVDLYQRFADAWRVTSASSLFDYSFGTSTNTYTLRSWPGENPTTCRVPAGTPGKPNKPPPAPLPAATARLYCQGVADAERRQNCEQDVAVTGNGGFASTYIATERIDNNRPPARPALISPENDKTNLSFKLTFTWTKVTDPEGRKVSYSHCVWPTDTTFSHSRCIPVVPNLFNSTATTLSATYLDLACPKTFYWKVIAQDEEGNTRESETRRFATK